MYKLLAVDMDGTLLNSDRTISEVNKEAINKAVKKGVQVVVTSGRGRKGVEHYLNEINLAGENHYLIANNGGTVYRTSDFKCIAYKGLKGRDLKKLYVLSKRLGLYIMAYTHEDTIAADENELVRFEREFIGNPIYIVDFNTDIDDDDDITKIIFSQTEEVLDKKMLEIPEEFFGKYNFVKTMPHILEIMNKGCNKGYGVRALAEKLGIKKNEVICIGDQANDIEMVDYAGLGIAMGNAIDELKNVAQYVTSVNDDGGVAKAIEKFIL